VTNLNDVGKYYGVDMSPTNTLFLQTINDAQVTAHSSTSVALTMPDDGSVTTTNPDGWAGYGDVWHLTGTFTAFDTAGHPTAGTITEIDDNGASGAADFTWTGLNLDVTEVFTSPTAANWQTLLADATSGNDSITTSDAPTPNYLAGGEGADTLNAAAAAQSDTLFGGAGNDSIVGGTGFNQVNGNQGDDVVVGHSTVGDWLLGGQGNDMIDASASTGANILNGNLGGDTIIGGTGADSLRGGQGDDVIHADSGNDWISGDLGNNTIHGGQGMDTFHASAGHDVIDGWHAGDHVQVDSGVTYTVSQVGADVHVAFSSGGEIDLLNIQQSSLESGWIA
jgi:Ca2+-binding RTX toxin-like protein